MPTPVPTFAVRQVKFNNGEISPSLYGDVSHPKFMSSLRTCKNWLPIQNGALVKWPGTKFVGYTKFQDPASNVRLETFTFSDQQSFLLEIGDRYIRFWQKSQYVGVDGSLHTYGDAYAGGYYEVVTPFVGSDLPYLKWAQVGNTINFTVQGPYPNNPRVPQDLKRTANALTPWTLTPTPTQIPAGAVTWAGPGPLPATSFYASTGPTTGPVWNPGERALFGDTSSPANLIEWICIQSQTQGQQRQPPNGALNATSTAVAGNLWWMPVVDRAHPAIKQNWAQTAVVQDSNGVVYESGLSPVVTVNSSLSEDRPMPILPGTPTLAAGYTLLFYKMYRGAPGGVYGLVDVVTPANLVPYPTFIVPVQVWLDDGRTPDFTKQPPTGTDPFLISGVGDAYPAVVGYLDQRRVFAGGAGLPNGLALSRDGDFYNWDDKNVPGADTDSIRLLLASEVLEDVRSIVSLARGIVLTGQGEFTLSGVNGGALSRSSRSAIRQSKWGSSFLNPIVIGKGLLFNTVNGDQIRDFYPMYGLYNDIWDGQDLTVTARHLFELCTFSAWAFQTVPYPVVRAVRNDGTVIGLTYQHAPPSFGQQLTEGVSAWSQRTTGYGYDYFQAVAVVPEPPERAVYYTVVRMITPGLRSRFIEREASPAVPSVPALYNPLLPPPGTPHVFASLIMGTKNPVPDARYGVFLDSSLQFDGHVDPTNLGNLAYVDSLAHPGSVNPADYVQGSQVKFVVTGGNAPFLATDPANKTIVVLDTENAYGLGQVTLIVTGYTNASQVTCDVLDTSMTAAQLALWAFTSGGAYHWAIGRTTYSALHLTGYPVDSGIPGGARGVWVLADGYQVDPVNFTWVNGVLTLNTAAVVVCVGIAYNADAELLDAFHPNKELRNLKKTLIKMGFEVANTRDLYVGRDANNLRQWIQKTVASSWSFPLSTGYFETSIDGGTNKDGRALIRHFTPLPATLTSVLREYELGGT